MLAGRAPKEILAALRHPSVPTAVLLLLSGIAVGVAVMVIGPASAAESPAVTVSAQRGAVQKTVTGTGSLEAGSEANLNFQTSGTIEAIYVSAGEHVSKGQLLAILDDTAARQSLAEAQAGLDSAEAALYSARVGGSSSSSTGGQTNTSQGTPTSASATSSTMSSRASKASKAASIAQAEASVESSQISVGNAEQALKDTRLRAPMDGLVASVSGERGQAVTAGTGIDNSSSSNPGSSSTASPSASASTPSSTTASSSSSSSSDSSSAVIVLQNLDRMKVSVDLSEADVGEIKPGQPASITMTALDSQKFAAHVSSIGLVSSSSNDVVSYPVTLVLDQDSSKLKPGMTAAAEVVVAQVNGVVAIPNSALQGNTVSIERDGKTVTQPVTTGLAGDDTTEIVSGLSDGEKVVMQTQSAIGGGSLSGLPDIGGGGGGLSAGGPPGGIGGGGGPPGVGGGP
ncbi:MAG: efflux RND transporter periplasmic adaptor subunit [Solirubrobacterales bacterium]